MEHKTLIFLGRSGAGKGTQIKLLTDKLEATTQKKVLYIESGRKFREFIAEDNCSADKAREIVSQGALQPAFLAVWVWADELVRKVTCNEHVIFDGTPRRKSEAHILESALEFYKFNSPQIIHLNVGRDWAMERLRGRGRDDDTDESIRARMEWFENDTKEVVDYLKSSTKYEFFEIDGERTIEEVHAHICQVLHI